MHHHESFTSDSALSPQQQDLQMNFSPTAGPSSNFSSPVSLYKKRTTNAAATAPLSTQPAATAGAPYFSSLGSHATSSVLYDETPQPPWSAHLAAEHGEFDRIQPAHSPLSDAHEEEGEEEEEKEEKKVGQPPEAEAEDEINAEEQAEAGQDVDLPVEVDSIGEHELAQPDLIALAANAKILEAQAAAAARYDGGGGDDDDADDRVRESSDGPTSAGADRDGYDDDDEEEEEDESDGAVDTDDTEGEAGFGFDAADSEVDSDEENCVTEVRKGKREEFKISNEEEEQEEG